MSFTAENITIALNGRAAVEARRHLDPTPDRWMLTAYEHPLLDPASQEEGVLAFSVWDHDALIVVDGVEYTGRARLGEQRYRPGLMEGIEIDILVLDPQPRQA